MAARRPWTTPSWRTASAIASTTLLRVGRSHERDLERIRKAREEGIRRNSVLTGNKEGGEIPTVVAIVEATGERVEETEPEVATPKPKKTKNAPEWKSLPDAEKAQYLLDHQTISDRSVADQLSRFVSATLRNASRRSVAPAASSSGAHPPER